MLILAFLIIVFAVHFYMNPAATKEQLAEAELNRRYSKGNGKLPRGT